MNKKLPSGLYIKFQDSRCQLFPHTISLVSGAVSAKDQVQASLGEQTDLGRNNLIFSTLDLIIIQILL